MEGRKAGGEIGMHGMGGAFQEMFFRERASRAAQGVKAPANKPADPRRI